MHPQPYLSAWICRVLRLWILKVWPRWSQDGWLGKTLFLKKLYFSFYWLYKLSPELTALMRSHSIMTHFSAPEIYLHLMRMRIRCFVNGEHVDKFDQPAIALNIMFVCKCFEAWLKRKVESLKGPFKGVGKNTWARGLPAQVGKCFRYFRKWDTSAIFTLVGGVCEEIFMNRIHHFQKLAKHLK